MDSARILPYVVPPAYVEGQPVSASGMIRHLGHDAYVMLVHDLDGICRNVMEGELSGTADDLFKQAVENLERRVRAGEIKLSVNRGPRGLPIVIAGGHWAAASCILLPKLFELCSKHVGPELLVAVPSRSSMLVFGAVDEGYIREMQAMIENAERGEPKRVTDSLFRITAVGVEPYGPTLPPPSVA